MHPNDRPFRRFRSSLPVHGRLHRRIYLAVLGAVAAVAALAALSFHLSAGGESGGALETAAQIASEVLPPATAPAADQQAALERWHARTHASFSLYSNGRGLLATAGQPLPAPPASWAASGIFRSGWKGPVFGLRLPDGRWLVARHPHRPGTVLGFLSLLFLVAAVVALAAYPVSRRLTRRLARLQESVEALGAGDLSVRVRVEGRDEVALLASRFNAAAARIEALVGSQKSLLANASHELRSPLARMKMAASLLEGNDRVREEIARDVAELDELVEEILLASRLDAGEGEEREEVDLTALAAEEAARAGASFDGPVVSLRGSTRLLRRLVRNLAENARRHGGEGPVEITLSGPVDGMALLDVDDRGPGVPAELRDRIFEPFFRLPGTAEGEGAPGTGLGLSIARQVARRHGGDVVCLPRDGGGSRFRATLGVSG